MNLVQIILVSFHFIIVLSIHVRVVPEFIWNRHFAGNFTSACTIPCIWIQRQKRNMDAIFNIVMNNHGINNAIANSIQSPISIIGCHEGGHYYSFVDRTHLRKHHQVSALLDRKSDIPWTVTINFVEAQ